VARTIREQIRSELSLAASAGVAPNKFLAKIASDWKKPDGLFVIQPEEVDSFLLPLPVDRLPGVGKVTEEKLKHVEYKRSLNCGESMFQRSKHRFGGYGLRLYELARGIDESEVVPDRPTQSISAEDTFEQDVLLTEMEPMIRQLAEHTWTASRKSLVFSFSTTVRAIRDSFQNSHSQPYTRLSTCSLRGADKYRPCHCGDVSASAQQRFRLVGAGLSNFLEPEDISAQPALFTTTRRCWSNLRLADHPSGVGEVGLRLPFCVTIGPPCILAKGGSERAWEL
jgi:DNA polymerase IV